MTTEEITYWDILEVRSGGDAVALNEASLSRVHKWADAHGADSFGILTAWLAKDAEGSAVPDDVNYKALQALGAAIRGASLGYFPLRGHWVNDEGVAEIEPSIFVPRIAYPLIVSLMKKFRQKAVIYKGPETKGDVWEIKSDGSHVSLGAFSPSKISAAYSSLRNGKPFTFESRPDGFFEAIAESRSPKPQWMKK